jgi:ribosomal protein L40E
MDVFAQNSDTMYKMISVMDLNTQICMRCSMTIPSVPPLGSKCVRTALEVVYTRPTVPMIQEVSLHMLLIKSYLRLI